MCQTFPLEIVGCLEEKWVFVEKAGHLFNLLWQHVTMADEQHFFS